MSLSQSKTAEFASASLPCQPCAGRTAYNSFISLSVRLPLHDDVVYNHVPKLLYTCMRSDARLIERDKAYELSLRLPQSPRYYGQTLV